MFVIRPFLIAVLVLASLLGPQWCCCGVGGTLAWLAGHGHDAPDVEVAVCACCADCTAGESAGDPASDEGPSCPCRERNRPSLTGAPVVPATLEASERQPAWPQGGVGLAPVVLVGGFRSSPPRSGYDRPAALSGRALLRACGVLRC